MRFLLLSLAWCSLPTPVACGQGPATLTRDHLLRRRYDQVAYLVSHNAMSNRDDGWLFPNQTHGITRQLKDGVRGLMLDVHDVSGQPYLVHSKAILGKRKLVDGLREIGRFLERDSRAVVTIIFESYVSAQSIQDAFRDAGLLESLHPQTPNQPWPTLQQMITTGKRLVVFTDRGGGSWPGYHDVWAFCQETHFSVKRVSDFTYRRNRGQASNPLMILNHFLTNPVAAPRLARLANATDTLGPRIRGCQENTGRFPNFIVVDFHEIGNTPATVEQFNYQHNPAP